MRSRLTLLPRSTLLLFSLIFVALAARLFFATQLPHPGHGDPAFYFTIITLTTVGYGDFSPKTDLGKLFTMVYVVLGLGIISSFILILARQPGKQQSALLQRFRSHTDTPPAETNSSDSPTKDKQP